MRHLSSLFLILILVFCSFSASAQEEAQELLQVLNPIQSLQADFVQTILDNRGKAVQRSQGKLFLKRPGGFRWDVQSPTPQLIVANNARLWIYDPDLEQVVIRPVAKEAGKTPAFLLSNVSTAITRDFTVRRMQAPRNWQWFSLTPKGGDSQFRAIQLGFLNHKIKELRMQDHLGHNTVIQLQHVKENANLKTALFQFHPPAKVDVIDETH